MKFGFSTITVNDMHESIEFYTTVLGLKELRSFSPNENIDIVFLTDGEIGKVELIKYKNKETQSCDCTNVSLGFCVADMDKAIEMLNSKGIAILHTQTSGPMRFLFIKDPNGVSIELIEGFNL